MVNLESILLGEDAENELRKDFTKSERYAIAKQLEALLGERRRRPSEKNVENSPHFELNRTTGHWYSKKLCENTLAVRPERSRPSGEVGEQAGRESGGLRLRCATRRPNG